VRELLARGAAVDCIVVSEERRTLLQESEALLSADAPRGRFAYRWVEMRTSASPAFRRARSLWRPFSDVYYADGLRQVLDAALREPYDVLHLDQLWSGWAGLRRERSLLNVHHFETIDWSERKLATFKERKALWQMTRATHRLVRAAPRMRMFTSRLREYAKGINPSANYWVVPFALDLSQYALQPLTDAPVVGLIGSMHWLPSRSAGERLIRRIWPLVKQRMPKARLRIAGWHAQRYLGHLLPAPDVTIEENLAHPSDFFSQISVMAYAPSRGSGTKVKVLEAMTYGVPVVTTSEGAEGIEAESGVHCWLEEDDERLAARICALLESRAARERMRLAARTLVEDRHSPKPVVDQMSAIYQSIATA
jgi:glycosyltransferase involved in cell wall biosynthesis